MVHGNDVIKATEMYGADVVEEIIEAVDMNNDDVMTVREMYRKTSALEHVECIDFLYKVPANKRFLVEHLREKHARY